MKLQLQASNQVKKEVEITLREKISNVYGARVDDFLMDVCKLQDQLLQDLYTQAGLTPPAALVQKRADLIDRFQRLQALQDHADQLIADAQAGKLVDISQGWPE